jgi:NADH-quinone oxidoreductase subunit E
MSIGDAEISLAPAERAVIAGMVGHYPTARAACIDAMRYLQRHRNHISDRTLAELATLLGMSTTELEEVATFYNLIFRKPVGEKIMLLCDSITCWMMGRDALSARITERVGIKPGETTPNGRLTLLPIVCLGHCDHAPALMVDETLYGDVDVAALDRLLSTLIEEPA